MHGIENIRTILKSKLQYVTDHFDELTNKDNPNFDQSVTDGIYNKLINYKYQIIHIINMSDFPNEERSNFETLLNEYNRVINDLGQYISLTNAAGGRKRTKKSRKTKRKTRKY